MDANEFKEFGRAAIDYLIDYHDNVRERPVLPSVKPGYLRPLIPDAMPEQPEHWRDILNDMDRVVMPGLTHWQAPGFHGFFPAGASFPSVVGELMSAGLGVLGFSWTASPACTELEMVMMDWLAKAMDLPQHLLNSADSDGGGCIQGSACEATLMGLLVAKEKTVRRIRKEQPHMSEQQVKARLVCYSSNQSNSSVEKASMLASVPIRLLEPDSTGRLGGAALEAAIQTDLAQGLIPCYMVASLGTTATCAFDHVAELGEVCGAHDVWLHVDAAYAGVALICPELRPLMRDGLACADSIVTNLHKWLMVNFDCSAMWFKSSRDIVETFSVERTYLSHKPDCEAPDLRNWQIPLSRRFRSLKVWFTLRAYGLRGLQAHIRSHVTLAQLFERLLLADPRFHLAAPTCMGLVCFRPKGDNKHCKAIIEEINRRKNVYMTPGKLFNSMFIRFALCSPNATEEDVQKCVREVFTATDIVTKSEEDISNKKGAVCLNDGSKQSHAEGVEHRGVRMGVTNGNGPEQSGVEGWCFNQENGIVSSDISSDQSNLVQSRLEENLRDIVAPDVRSVVSSDVRLDKNYVQQQTLVDDLNDKVAADIRIVVSSDVSSTVSSDFSSAVSSDVSSEVSDVEGECSGGDQSDDGELPKLSPVCKVPPSLNHLQSETCV